MECTQNCAPKVAPKKATTDCTKNHGLKVVPQIVLPWCTKLGNKILHHVTTDCTTNVYHRLYHQAPMCTMVQVRRRVSPHLSLRLRVDFTTRAASNSGFRHGLNTLCSQSHTALFKVSLHFTALALLILLSGLILTRPKHLVLSISHSPF